MLSRRSFALTLAAAALPAWAKPKQMRIVVPYPAGGPLDACSRLLADKLKTKLGRIIVENRPGAAGARGMLEVKNAQPNGQSLVVGALATLVVNPLMFNDLPYRPQDFETVCLLSDTPNVLIMTPATMKKRGINSAEDFIDFVKKHPNQLNCASGGTGSAGHIANALLNTRGLKTVHVPYAGAMAAQLSLLSAETDIMFDNFASARPAIEDSRVRVLAQTSRTADKRIPAPTLSSLGIDCDISTWFGLMAPKGTPTEIRENLFKEICLTLESNETMHTFERLSGGAKLLGPQEFNEWIQNEQVKYRSFLSVLKI